MAYTTMDNPAIILVSHKSFDVLFSVIAWIFCCSVACYVLFPHSSPKTAPSPPSEPSRQYIEPQPVLQSRPFPYYLLRPREQPEPVFEPQPVLQSPPLPHIFLRHRGPPEPTFEPQSVFRSPPLTRDFLHPRGPPELSYRPSYEPHYEPRLQPEPVPLPSRISNGLISRAHEPLRSRRSIPRSERPVTELSYRERQAQADRDEARKKRLDREAEAAYLALKAAANAARAQRVTSRSGGDVPTVPVVAEKDSAHEKPVTTKAKGRHVRFADDVKQSPTTTVANDTVATEITSAARAGVTHDSRHETGHSATKPTELPLKTAEPLARATHDETAYSSKTSIETPPNAEEPLTHHADIAASGNSTEVVGEQAIPYQAPANELMQADIQTAHHTLDGWLIQALNGGKSDTIWIHYWIELYTVLNFWYEWITCTIDMDPVVWDFGKLSYENIGSLQSVLDQIYEIIKKHEHSIDPGLLKDIEHVFTELRQNMNQATAYFDHLHQQAQMDAEETLRLQQVENDRVLREKQERERQTMALFEADRNKHLEEDRRFAAQCKSEHEEQQNANAKQQRYGQKEQAQSHPQSMQQQQQQQQDDSNEDLYAVSPRTEEKNLDFQLKAQKPRADVHAQNTFGNMQADEDEANLLEAELQKEFDLQNFKEETKAAQRSVAPSSTFGQQFKNPFVAPPPASGMQQTFTPQFSAADQQPAPIFSAPLPSSAVQPTLAPQPSALGHQSTPFLPTLQAASKARRDPVQKRREERQVANRIKNMNSNKATPNKSESYKAHAVVGPMPQLYKASQAAQTPAALGVVSAASISTASVPEGCLKDMATTLEQTNNKIDDFERLLKDPLLKNLSLQDKYIRLYQLTDVQNDIARIGNAYSELRQSWILSTGEYFAWNNETIPASDVADARLLYRIEKDHDFLKKVAIEIKGGGFAEDVKHRVREAMDEAYIVGSCLIKAGCKGVMPREKEGEDEYYYGAGQRKEVSGLGDVQIRAPAGTTSTSTEPHGTDFL